MKRDAPSETWITVRSAAVGEEWNGVLRRIEGEEVEWDFNIFRRGLFSDPFKSALFQNNFCVAIDLDFNRPATLILPQILSKRQTANIDDLDAGAVVYGGKAHGFLEGIKVLDYENQQFSRLSFNSKYFDIWNNWLPNLSEREKSVDDIFITIDSIGEFQIRRKVDRRESGGRPSVDTLYEISVDFLEKKSLFWLFDFAPTFEILFGMLLGVRNRFPIFRVSEERVAVSKIGFLELGYSKGEIDDRVNSFTAAHLRGVDGVTLFSALTNYYEDMTYYRDVSGVCDHVRFFSSDVEANFRLVAPRFEHELQRRFASVEEKSFIKSQTEFFRYIDASDNENIREFCKKHVEIKDRKAIPFKAKIVAAIEYLNERGCVINLGWAQKISNRRNKLFHSNVVIKSNEIVEMYNENNVMVGVLLLLAFDRLGVDIGIFYNRHHALSDLRSVLFQNYID